MELSSHSSLGFFVPLRFTARDSEGISRVATEESGKRQGELKTEFIVVADTHVRVSPERHGVESVQATLLPGHGVRLG